jgi:cation transporter-like permease
MSRVRVAETAATARRIGLWGGSITLIGAVVTLLLSIGSDAERPIARVGAIITITGLAVTFVATPIAFALTITSIQSRLRRCVSLVRNK